MTTPYLPNPEVWIVPALIFVAAVHQTEGAVPSQISDKITYTQSDMGALPLPDGYVQSQALTEADQARILEGFVSKLLEGAKEPPQQIVDLLNKHFWDLL